MMKFSLGLIIFLVTACSNLDMRSPVMDAAFSGGIWTLSGKISIKYRSRGFTSRMIWHQQGTSSEILFNGPFGRSFKVSSNKSFCVLEDSTGEVFQADSLELLMMEKLGWFFPLDRAVFWVRGLPYPIERLESSKENAPGVFRQGAWAVRIEEYFSSRLVPRRIILSSESEKINIKIIVKEWKFKNEKIL